MKVKEAQRLETVIDQEIERLKDRLARSSSTHKTRTLAESAFRERHEKTLEQMAILLDIKFAIRKAIAEFNRNHAINERTAKIAHLTKLLELIKGSLVNQASSVNHYNSKEPEYREGYSDQLEDVVLAECRKITREIQRLKDSCNGINSQGTIAISESQVEYLKKLGIL